MAACLSLLIQSFFQGVFRASLELFFVSIRLDNQNDDNTFYVEGLTYNQALNYEICTDDLNKYYTHFMLQGHEEGVCTNIYGVDSYYNTEIIDYSKEISPNNWTILYIGYIYNATRVWRSDLIYPYPDPIDD